MHETALAQGILRIVLEEAKKHGVRRITEIRLRIGLLSSVEAHALCACFELLAEKSAAEGAALEVEKAPLPARCAECGQAFELTVRRFVCPHCGGADITFSGGRECEIVSISAEKPPAA